MRRIWLLRAGPRLILTAIVVASLALRLWGREFGLPASTRYHPDEHALVDRAAEILWTGDWNLHRFNYPPFYAYLQTGAYAAYGLWGAARGQWEQIPSFTLPQYYHVGRLLTAIVGTLTILVVFLAGRRIGGRRVGLAAAALLGGCYLHVIHSHYATFDIMVAFLVALTYLFSERLRTEPKARWYLLTGLCAGLAGATKYNGALALIMLMVAHILVTPWGEWGWLNDRLLVGVAGFLLGFFGGNPYALGNLPAFLSGLATVLNHYGTTQPGFEGEGNWRWYLGSLLTSADSLWACVGTAGLFGLTWRQWRRGLLLLVFPVLYFALISSFVVRFERNMVPLLPFLALGGGWLLDAIVSRLARRAQRLRSHVGGLVAIGTIAVLALPVAASMAFGSALSRTDEREQAGQWVEQNVAPGTKIAIEHYSVPFDYDRYHVEDVIRAHNHDLAWYRQEGFELIIISDGVWELLRREPETYGKQMEFYKNLVAHSTLLAEFVPKPRRLVTAGYATVGVYHFAPARIFQLAR